MTVPPCVSFNEHTGRHFNTIYLSLQEFVTSLHKHCTQHHSTNCRECPQLLKAAQTILANGLKSLFKVAFPDVTYTAYNARRRLSQLPLVTIRIGNRSSGNSTIIVMEYVNGVDYIKFAHYLIECMC